MLNIFNQSIMLSTMQQYWSIPCYRMHQIRWRIYVQFHIFVAGLFTKVGGSLVVAFTIFQLFKAYKTRQNDLKRRRKQANKESSIRRIKEKCKHIQV